MPRYIDADKLKSHYAWWNNEDKELFDTIVDFQPNADVREVKRGHWIICGAFDDLIKCSCCVEQGQGRDRPIPHYGVPKWCEDCGAKMDMED